MTQSDGLPELYLFANQYYEEVGLSPALVILIVVFTLMIPKNLDSLLFKGSGPSQSHSLYELSWLKKIPSVN